ncbi:hypothetical protein GPALN_005171 [Globodera pallida]|nr:hypothetical protein GPALN_005171 [Globodera pallida]
MNISQRLLEYIMLSFMDVQHLLSVSDQDELALADEEWKEFTHFLAPKFTVNGFFWNASANCQQILKLCSFGGREFDCCEYAKGILTDIGKCYQLDLSSTDQPWLRGQVQAGINNGLQIIVDARTEQQTNSLFLDTAHPFADSLDTGFRYYVHEQFSLPYLSTEGISVSPGTKAYSAISPTHYILLPQEMWGNCSDRWPKDLQQIVFIGEVPFSYNVDEFYSVCTPYEIYKCLNSTVLNDTKWFQNGMARPGLEDFHQIIPVCPQCKIECQRWVYHTYNSYAQAFPHKSLGRLRRKASQWSSIVSLNIFYRDMAYTEYKQVQSLSMTEILSDIGGNMGLFLGMSLISLIEFVTYICKISWLFISKKRRDHMLAKKRRDEEREQQLQQTLEMTNSRTNDLPTSQFDTIIRRISRSIQRKPARAEKSVFILPESGQRQNAESDIPSSTKLTRPANSLKRSQSVFSALFGQKKSLSSNASRKRDLVDSIIESRLHGNAGRAARRSSTSSSSEDGIDSKEHNEQHQLPGIAPATERKEVELKIDLESKTVMLVGPPQGARRYSTTAILSYDTPTATTAAKNVVERSRLIQIPTENLIHAFVVIQMEPFFGFVIECFCTIVEKQS